MPRKPRPSPAIDIRSEEVVLFYVGDGPIYAEAPARDLNGADLVRLARIEALRASGGEPVGAATADELEALATRLSSSGAFERQAPITTDTSASVEDALAVEREDPEAPGEPAEETI